MVVGSGSTIMSIYFNHLAVTLDASDALTLPSGTCKEKSQAGHKEPLWGHKCRHAAATRGIPTLIRLCMGAGERKEGE